MQEQMRGVSWQNTEECPTFEELRLLKVPYKRLDGEKADGEMIVHVSVADEVLAIFQDIMKCDFRIHRMFRIEHFNGSDEESMAANNSSGFNFRTIEGQKKLSAHAKGLAVDINPRWNPWVRGGNVSPPSGASFLDRDLEHPGLIRKNGKVVDAFRRRGWDWGGLWSNSKDYHHFQKV